MWIIFVLLAAITIAVTLMVAVHSLTGHETAQDVGEIQRLWSMSAA
jgi:hypothetical protein